MCKLVDDDNHYSLGFSNKDSKPSLGIDMKGQFCWGSMVGAISSGYFSRAILFRAILSPAILSWAILTAHPQNHMTEDNF